MKGTIGVRPRCAWAGMIARYGPKEVRRLLADPGIIRNRLKVEAAILNARRVLEIQGKFGSFDRYIWEFVGGKPIDKKFTSVEQIPATTPMSDRMSKDLKRRGFKFVGSTICYAFMQAVGMVNDHEAGCFGHDLVSSRG